MYQVYSDFLKKFFFDSFLCNYVNLSKTLCSILVRLRILTDFFIAKGFKTTPAFLFCRLGVCLLLQMVVTKWSVLNGLGMKISTETLRQPTQIILSSWNMLNIRMEILVLTGLPSFQILFICIRCCCCSSFCLSHVIQITVVKKDEGDPSLKHLPTYSSAIFASFLCGIFFKHSARNCLDLRFLTSFTGSQNKICSHKFYKCCYSCSHQIQMNICCSVLNEMTEMNKQVILSQPCFYEN